MRKQGIPIDKDCRSQIQGIRDTMDILSGKWKPHIITALYNNGCFRFMDLVRHIDGIAPKVLSKELKDLEIDKIIDRTVLSTMPLTVEYELTKIGESLYILLRSMSEWGIDYRQNVYKSRNQI
ncbi:winged helix-turn-helix transcriptional regulator [Sphingobacterium sp. NGMCC 1.201703]|uniref:winged helix-turn-helix transcriptional regulator n=1 Tax=Sphingobacterium sp. NGMCC 1.201703 TaxID=3388657 RepID=UPI0039FBB87C